ncbi:Uncharacterised protein [Klebsiella pneumoniae]|nr:Uncharacterised protein [Klebsiella pneumoniae]
MRSGNLFCQHRMAADRQGGGRRLIHQARAGAQRQGHRALLVAKLQSANQRQGELLAQIIKNLRQIVSRVIVVRRAAGEAAEDHRFLRRQHAAVQQLKQHALDAETGAR